MQYMYTYHSNACMLYMADGKYQITVYSCYDLNKSVAFCTMTTATGHTNNTHPQ